MRAEIVVPFYNESHRIEQAVQMLGGELSKNEQVLKNWFVRFWWIDDGSVDGSSAKLNSILSKYFSAPVQHVILRTEKNSGKGSAMRTAIAQLRTRVEPTSVVAFWDSDAELHPESLYKGLELLVSQNADVVFGSRFMQERQTGESVFHYLGNKALTAFSNLFSSLDLSDVHCCARIMRAELLFALPLASTGFDFEAEFVALVGRVRSPKLKILEIPIKYMPRTVAQGKKIGVAHILPQVKQALRCRYFQKPIHLQSIGSHDNSKETNGTSTYK